MELNNTLTSIKSSTNAAYAEAASTRTNNSELDQNAFLQLLMTQLQYQDPMNPTGSEEFIQQQASFTQISELQKMNGILASSSQMMQASSLIDKEVTITDPNDSSGESTITGVVTEANINSTGASIVIDGNSYPLDLILNIKNQSTEM